MVTTEFRFQGHRIHKYFINEKEETICIKKIGNDRRSYFFPIKFNVWELYPKINNYLISFQCHDVVKTPFAVRYLQFLFFFFKSQIFGYFHIVWKIQRLERSPVFCSFICWHFNSFFCIRNNYVKICFNKGFRC